MFNSPVHNYGIYKDLHFSQPFTTKHKSVQKIITKEEVLQQQQQLQKEMRNLTTTTSKNQIQINIPQKPPTAKENQSKLKKQDFLDYQIDKSQINNYYQNSKHSPRSASLSIMSDC